ncbi:thioredoxin family protein [Pararhodonellum marinum]|uniref:thioredoxin family protein n=1 Tax=Pararhodonellum marinum TaxID=2755358 RepID=UPI00188EE9BB|nr:thioredoxin family protein [Pararhodonellum marinum]
MHIISKESLITHDRLEKALDYTQYKTLIYNLLAEGRTTGSNHSEAMLGYTFINLQRMSRWDKTAKVSIEAQAQVQQIREKQTWLILTEAWCGDAAQNIPYLVKLAGSNPLIKVKFILRDENPDLMEAFLTNGTRSIPKLVAIREKDLSVAFTWGPRPQLLQEKYQVYKANPELMEKKAFAESVHLWYAKNKNQALEAEFLNLLRHSS